MLHLFEALHRSTHAGVRRRAVHAIVKVQLLNRSACALVRDAKEGEMHGDSLRVQSTMARQAATTAAGQAVHGVRWRDCRHLGSQRGWPRALLPR